MPHLFGRLIKLSEIEPPKIFEVDYDWQIMFLKSPRSTQIVFVSWKIQQKSVSEQEMETDDARKKGRKSSVRGTKKENIEIE